MKKKLTGFLFYKMILLLVPMAFLCHKISAQTSDVVGKVTVGYQGWFAATGDGSPINAWWHWTQDWSQLPSSTNNGIKSWPDVRDYTSTYATAWPNLNNGQPAKLFSSFNDQTVNTQFLWMQQNGIDCAALQRFNPTGGEGPVRDAITAKVKTAAETTGRKFYIMYDVSGWTNMQSEIKNDWTTKMSQYISSSAYARHNGKPVVCIWGFGFNDNNHPWTADVCLDVINWFKGQGCYVIGGVPREWRSGTGGSRAGYTSVYHALNMISPWLIGAVSTVSGADDIYNNFFLPDEADCNANGVAYQPCVLPGDLQERQRVHGDLMWRMFYNAVRAGSQGIYISMFDEYNEGNQIAKTAENVSQVPAGSAFLPLDEDGTAMSSDYYLRLTGDGGKMLKGQIALTATRPTPFFATVGAPVITSSSSASGTVGSPFNYAIIASNTPTSYGASGLPSGLSVNTSTGVISGTSSVSGTFNSTITATNSSGTGSKALTIILNIVVQGPYLGTPWAIPGTIEVENFDTGGEGIAYHDNDAINSGGQGRTAEGVDTETCSEGGLNIGWTNTGEWMEYTVNVALTGTYNVDVRTASLFTGGTFHIEFNGVDKTGLFTAANTGAWQTWTTLSKSGISLSAGQQIMRIFLDNANFNLNKVIFTSTSSIPVTGVTVSPATATLNAGGTQQLTATVAPANATNKNVTWSTSNASVATVNASGLVTAVANGSATITVTTQDGGKTATSAITVSNIAVTGVTVSPTTATLNAGGTQQLTATVAPANATNKNVTWSTSNASVATVNASGLVSAIANGSATITVTTQDGSKTATSSITVSVPAGTVICYRNTSAVTVNGSLTEVSWSLNQTVSKTTVGTVNNTVTFGVLWDNTNLYIGAKILDANLFSDSPNTWDDDAIEVYIDANNNKLGNYDGLDNQIIKNYNKSTVFTKLAITGLQHAWASITGGYSVELAIPWSQLGISAPAQGTTIGFDLGYDDDDNAGVRDGQAVWNGNVNNYTSTTAFGSLVLNSSNSPAGRVASEAATISTENAVMYWPTIVESDLNIETDGSYQSIEVVDMLGRVHHHDSSIEGKTLLTVDLSNLTGGMHLVKLRGAQKANVFRIVKK